MLDSKLTQQNPMIGRRGLLGGALLGIAGLGLSACGSTSESAVGTAPAATTAEPAEVAATEKAEDDGSTAIFRDLEQSYGARLGVYALDTDSGKSLGYQADEVFAMCSTFKILAVGAVLAQIGVDKLSDQVEYTKEDMVAFSPVTKGQTSMSLGDLCAAALQQSDNTAANLLVREVGGPQAVTQFARALGDKVTRLDRLEPELNEAVPGDERDTSNPEMLGNDLYTLVDGDALNEVARRKLKDWLLGNTTGGKRIRAGVPKGWEVADKTGSGSYGSAHDIALLYPKGNKAPIVLAIMSSRENKDDGYNEKLLADATRTALEALRA